VPGPISAKESSEPGSRGSALQWLDVKKLAEYHVSLQRQILLLSLKRGGAAGRGWGGCFFSVFLFLSFYYSFPFLL
jgi:hypothetical protein